MKNVFGLLAVVIPSLQMFWDMFSDFEAYDFHKMEERLMKEVGGYEGWVDLLYDISVHCEIPPGHKKKLGPELCTFAFGYELLKDTMEDLEGRQGEELSYTGWDILKKAAREYRGLTDKEVYQVIADYVWWGLWTEMGAMGMRMDREIPLEGGVDAMFSDDEEAAQVLRHMCAIRSLIALHGLAEGDHCPKEPYRERLDGWKGKFLLDFQKESMDALF